MILPRYLYRQTLVIALMTLLVLMGVVLALFLAELLSQAAQGQVIGASVLALLVLKLPEALLMVAPLALLVGILLALGQAAERSEVIIARASGVSYVVCFAPLVGLALMWSLAVVFIGGWVAPWAMQQTQSVLERGAEQALLASLQPGQFDRFDQGRVTVYIASIDANQGELTEVFLQHAANGSEEVVSAPKGRLWHDPADQSRYLSLQDGHQLHRSVEGEWMRVRFASNDVRLPAAAESEVSETEMGMTLAELTPANTPLERREWHWRVASPMGSLLLGLLAIPLAWRSPRSGRFGSVVLAMVVYLIYSNCVHVGLVWMEDANSLIGPGLWPIHASLALLVAGLWLWRWRQW